MQWMWDWSAALFNLHHLTMNDVNTRILAMGTCQGQNDAKIVTQSTDLAQSTMMMRSPSSAQHLGHDARHMAGLCGWPPCLRRLQWGDTSCPDPFPPKFLLWSLFSHLQNQTAAGPWPCTAPGWASHGQLWSWGSLCWLSLQPPG